MLRYLVDRLERCRELEGVILATSTEQSDDAIDAFAKHERLGCFRGSIENVAERMLAAATTIGCDAFVRISGDSPLIDQTLVDRAVNVFREKGPDLVTNVQERTFPKGQSVEVIDVGAMAMACADMQSDDEREHVTPYFYANPARFKIAAFTSPRNYGSVRVSVDTSEDLARFERILDHLGEPHWTHGLESVVAAARVVNGRRREA